MSGLDLLISIFLLSSALTGYRRGIFREVLATALWLPTLFGIGFVITHSITLSEGVNTENLNLLWTIIALYLMGVITIWAIDHGFIQPHFKGNLQSTSRLFYKLCGLGLALLRSWWILIAGLALYMAYVSMPDDDLQDHGYYMPHLSPSAQNLSTWLQEQGYIQREEMVYTDEVYTYQSEADEAKELLKNSFTNSWTNPESVE